MDLQTTQPEPIALENIPVQPIPPSSKSKLPLILAGIILLVIVGTGGLILSKSLNPSQPPAQPTVVPIPTQIPTTTPNPTANWKTYTNGKNNYTFKYPANFNYLADRKDNIYIAPSEGTGEGRGGPFGLDLTKDSWFSINSNVLDSAGTKYWNDTFSNSISNITIDGTKAYKSQFLPKEASEPAYGYQALFIKDGIIYKFELVAANKEIGISPEAEKTFDQILSTFKFLE